MPLITHVYHSIYIDVGNVNTLRSKFVVKALRQVPPPCHRHRVGVLPCISAIRRRRRRVYYRSATSRQHVRCHFFCQRKSTCQEASKQTHQMPRVLAGSAHFFGKVYVKIRCPPASNLIVSVQRKGGRGRVVHTPRARLFWSLQVCMRAVRMQYAHGHAERTTCTYQVSPFAMPSRIFYTTFFPTTLILLGLQCYRRQPKLGRRFQAPRISLRKLKVYCYFGRKEGKQGEVG